MQTPAEEYGLQEVCHILSPLGRTFNLLSRGTAPFQVARLKDLHLRAFFPLTLRRSLRGEKVFDLNGATMTAGVEFPAQTELRGRLT